MIRARVGRWLLKATAAGLWIVAGGTLAAWIVSRVLTDQYEWSQFLYWIPTRLSLIASAAALLLAWVLHAVWLCAARGRVGGSETRSPEEPTYGQAVPVVTRQRARWAPRPLWAASLVWVCCLAYAGIVEWRWHVMPGVLIENGQPRVRVAFWNFGGWERTGWVDLVKPRDADLLILASQIGSRTRQEFTTLGDERTELFPIDRFLIATRLRMIEHGSTMLGIEAGIGIDPRAPGGVRQYTDPGMAVYMVFEDPLRPAEPDARLVVWIIDLPSDPSLHRPVVTREARAAIENWHGIVQRRVLVADDDSTTPDGQRARGQWVSIHPADRESSGIAAKGFPPPDLIVGDFNIPRGSGSLLELTAGLRNVYDMAGTGGMETFPRTVDYLGIDNPRLRRMVGLAGMPAVHIDQMFVREPIRAVRYEVLDLGMASHLMQVCDLER